MGNCCSSTPQTGNSLIPSNHLKTRVHVEPRSYPYCRLYFRLCCAVLCRNDTITVLEDSNELNVGGTVLYCNSDLQVRLDAGHDATAGEQLREQHSVVALLIDGFRVKDGPREEFRPVWDGEKHLAVQAPVLFGVGDAYLFLYRVGRPNLRWLPYLSCIPGGGWCNA